MSQRPVHQHADIVGETVRQHVVLDLPTEQVIGRLQRLNRQRRGEFGHLLGVVIRDADMADLALDDQIAQRTRRLGHWYRRIGPMHLVQVDVVDTQCGQACVHPFAQPIRTCVASETGIGLAQTAFGGDDTSSSRSPTSSWRNALPRIRSDAPKPYAWAVSKKLTPNSRARRIAATALASSNRPQSPPSCQVPNAIRDTSRPLRPNVVVFMRIQSHRASAALRLRGRMPAFRTGVSVSLPLIRISGPRHGESPHTCQLELASAGVMFAVACQICS